MSLPSMNDKNLEVLWGALSGKHQLVQAMYNRMYILNKYTIHIESAQSINIVGNRYNLTHTGDVDNLINKGFEMSTTLSTACG